MKLSHSSISTYTDCPLKWKLKYVDRTPERPRHFFSFGKSVHAALEYMYAGDSCPVLVAVLDKLDHEWLSEGYKDEAAERKAKREAVAMVTAYYNAYAPLWARPVSTELKFDITVDHVRVTGFVDRVDALPDGLHVLDYKTGRELEPDRALQDEQLTMYQMAVEELDMGPVARVSLFHVPTLTWHSSPRHDSALVDALRAKIRRTADAIADRKFEPTPSEKACAWCDYKKLCPAWVGK